MTLKRRLRFQIASAFSQAEKIQADGESVKTVGEGSGREGRIKRNEEEVRG